MSSIAADFLHSSILRKQIVAITGVMMAGFILMHLAANLLVLAGPGPFNGYAESLAAVPELLWIARIGLITAFVLHVFFTIAIAIENRGARDSRYAVSASKGDALFARRFMVLTGILVFLFLFIHLRDFTLGDKTGASSVVPGANNGESLGLYGLVWNSFLQPARSILYMLWVTAAGVHLSHGVQSMFQTLGFNHPRYTPKLIWFSAAIGLIVALGFSIIPLYVLVKQVPSL